MYSRANAGRIGRSRGRRSGEEVGLIGVAAVEAAWGPVHLAADADGLVALEVMTTAEAFTRSVTHRFGDPSAGRPLRSGAASPRRPTPSASTSRRHRARSPISFLAGLSTWDRRVLAGVHDIPWGEVTSYGRLARDRSTGAARAVGGSVRRNRSVS
jgi:O6-methylguanine-DNA--protein-cysteine methyltransferase